MQTVILYTLLFSTAGEGCIGRGKSEGDWCWAASSTHRTGTRAYRLSYKTHTNLHCSLQFLLTQFGRRNQSLSSIIRFTKALAALLSVFLILNVYKVRHSSSSCWVLLGRALIQFVLGAGLTLYCHCQSTETTQNIMFISNNIHLGHNVYTFTWVSSSFLFFTKVSCKARRFFCSFSRKSLKQK